MFFVVYFFIIFFACLLICKYNTNFVIERFIFPRKIVTISEFRGQMGNHLFQIAAALHIAMHNSARVVLPPVFTTLPVSSLIETSGFSVGSVVPLHTFQERSFTDYYVPTLGSDTNILALDGYFQNRLYLNGIQPLVLKQHSSFDKYSDYIGIHVRRGDYLAMNDIYNVLSSDYFFKNALSLINKTYKPKVVVCSDDIDWCKSNLKIDGIPIVFSQNDEITDFNILAGCRKLIMSNSTFSWWCAQFGNKTDVIFPWPWFKGTLNKASLNDLALPNWTISQGLSH